MIDQGKKSILSTGGTPVLPVNREVKRYGARKLVYVSSTFKTNDDAWFVTAIDLEEKAGTHMFRLQDWQELQDV